MVIGVWHLSSRPR